MEKETYILGVNNWCDLKDQRIEETKLNDFIWFDTDYIEEVLNVKLWEDE